ncbi:MAG TPA: TetR/AcrR family transcriptional regulator C-terminal domain-containing protein [Streptosporangiaceae bacterium]|nr:TetR/AcrR family transcriptional regulator C-terminal domain-containing protein [Streptosporangiaceae bacterium]
MPSGSPPRPRLNRDRVVRAAVQLADGGGFDALSMRKLAEQLGVVPMALYKHVADKDELLDEMIDRVFAEVEVPDGCGWRTAMRERAAALRAALLRHPWAVGRMETGTPGPANLRHHNAVMACLRSEAGLGFRAAVHAYSAMDSYIYGFALQEKTLSGDIPAEARRRGAVVADRDESYAELYPYLLEVVYELSRTGYDLAQEFEFGLDLILDGIERLRSEFASS